MRSVSNRVSVRLGRASQGGKRRMSNAEHRPSKAGSCGCQRASPSPHFGVQSSTFGVLSCLPALLLLTLAASVTLAAPAVPVNVAAAANGTSISGPVNCSGSRGKPPVAIDGDVSVYGPSLGYMWAYLKTPMTVTFGKPETINAVELLLLDIDRRDYGYVIEVSTDGKQWQQVHDAARARNSGWQLHRFAPTSARMLRITFTRTSVGVGSYHVVEVAAYDLPADVTETPLRQQWQATRQRRALQDVDLLGASDAQQLLNDRDLLRSARALGSGNVLHRDLDGDGDPDALIFRDKVGIVIALDDDDDMSPDTTAPDGRDDCLAVDLGADGKTDRSVDFSDSDHDGVVDTMVQAYISGSPWGRRALVLIRDLDQRGPKRLWHLTPDYGYNQASCQWHCDFGGDGFFVMFTRDRRQAEWVGSFENPFCFYDPDGDGFAEETVRISGRGTRLRSVRYGVNADNDMTEGEDYDYDVSVTALGDVQPGPEELTRFKLRTGELTGEYLRWDRTREVVRQLPWDRALLVWDENDHNVARGRRQRERWEGIINSSYSGPATGKRFPQEGGPPCGLVNKRYELDSDLSGKMTLYYWEADRRLHLLGAEDGTLTVDYDNDGRVDMIVHYVDSNDDGCFDRRTVVTAFSSAPRVLAAAPPPAERIELSYADIHPLWSGKLTDTLEAQTALLSALADLLGESPLANGPMAYYATTTPKRFAFADRMRASREARRFYQDVEIELSFAVAEQRCAQSQGTADTAEMVAQARTLADVGALREAARVLRDAKLAPLPGKGDLPRADAKPTSAEPGAFAMLGSKITAGWESDIVAYRAYWGKIDAFGKTDSEMHLADFNRPGAAYHNNLGWGMDILHVGATSGIGGLNIWHAGKRLKAQWSKADDPAMPLVYRVSASGPEQAAIEMDVSGWQTPLGMVDITRRFSIRRDHRHTVDELRLRCASQQEIEFGPGLTVLKNGASRQSAEIGYVAVWGDQDIGAGEVGLAVVFDPKLCRRIEAVQGEFLVHLLATGPEVRTVMLLAAAWARAGEITSAETWFSYVEELARPRESP